MRFSSWKSDSPNQNLLINWDFRNPINQRGQTEYGANNYGLDMWILSGDGSKSLMVRNGYIEIVCSSIGTWTNLGQRLECHLTSGTYTISFFVDDHTMVNQLVTEGTLNGKPSFHSVGSFSTNIITNTFTVLENEEVSTITLQMKERIGSLKVYAGKLEEGSISTLKLDLKNPLTYQSWQIELEKCQRYLQVCNGLVAKSDKPIIGILNAQYTTQGIAFIPTQVPLRTTPTIQLIGTAKLWNGVKTYDVTRISVSYSSAQGITATINSEGLTAGIDYMLRLSGTSSNLILSAEL